MCSRSVWPVHVCVCLDPGPWKLRLIPCEMGTGRVSPSYGGFRWNGSDRWDVLWDLITWARSKIIWPLQVVVRCDSPMSYVPWLKCHSAQDWIKSLKLHITPYDVRTQFRGNIMKSCYDWEKTLLTITAMTMATFADVLFSWFAVDWQSNVSPIDDNAPRPSAWPDIYIFLLLRISTGGNIEPTT